MEISGASRWEDISYLTGLSSLAQGGRTCGDTWRRSWYTGTRPAPRVPVHQDRWRSACGVTGERESGSGAGLVRKDELGPGQWAARANLAARPGSRRRVFVSPEKMSMSPERRSRTWTM